MILVQLLYVFVGISSNQNLSQLRKEGMWKKFEEETKKMLWYIYLYKCIKREHGEYFIKQAAGVPQRVSELFW